MPSLSVLSLCAKASLALTELHSLETEKLIHDIDQRISYRCPVIHHANSVG